MFFTEIGDRFVVHVNTQSGDDMTKTGGLFSKITTAELEEFHKLRKKKRSELVPEINLEPQKMPEIFARAWNNPVWEDLGRRCLSRGNCTNVCSTCYCYSGDGNACPGL